MSTDFRALCAELLDELVARPLCLDHALIDRARAALSEPADGPAAGAGQPSPTQTPANGPTRQELRQLFRDQSGYIDDEQVMWIDDFCAAASVVLARWGNHSADASKMVSPAEGEVAELVAWLKKYARADWLPDETTDKLARVAELLQRQAAPVPVAVRPSRSFTSPPRPEDCDKEGYCWRWNTIAGSWARQPISRSWYEFESHWLPAHALPLPAPGKGVHR